VASDKKIQYFVSQLPFRFAGKYVRLRHKLWEFIVKDYKASASLAL